MFQLNYDINAPDERNSAWIQTEEKNLIVEIRSVKDATKDPEKKRIKIFFEVSEGPLKHQMISNLYGLYKEARFFLRRLYLACECYTIEDMDFPPTKHKHVEPINPYDLVGKKIVIDVIRSKDPKFLSVTNEREIEERLIESEMPL